MAKVEMSLDEYNEIREELNFLRRVVKEVTTPKIDDWSLNYVREERTTILGNAELTSEVETYLQDQIERNIPASYKTDNLSAEIIFSNISLIKVSYSEPDSKKDSSEELEE